VTYDRLCITVAWLLVLNCRQDSGNKESTDFGSSFSSASPTVGSHKVYLIPTMPKMPFLMERFGESEGGGKKTVR